MEQVGVVKCLSLYPPHVFFLFDVGQNSKLCSTCQEKIAIYDKKRVFSDTLCKLYNFLHKK